MKKKTCYVPSVLSTATILALVVVTFIYLLLFLVGCFVSLLDFFFFFFFKE